MILWLLLFNTVPEHLTNRVRQEKDLSKKIKKETYICNVCPHRNSQMYTEKQTQKPSIYNKWEHSEVAQCEFNISNSIALLNISKKWNWIPRKFSSFAEFRIYLSIQNVIPFLVPYLFFSGLRSIKEKGGPKQSRTLWGLPGINLFRFPHCLFVRNKLHSVSLTFSEFWRADSNTC